MRSLIIALLVLSLTVTVMLLGGALVDRICDQMITRTEALAYRGSSGEPDATEQYWAEWRPRLRFFCKRNELGTVSDALTALCAASDSGDEAQFRIWQSLLKSSLEELRRSESLRWK